MAGRVNYQIGITADTTKAKQAIESLLSELDRIGQRPTLAANLHQASTAALELSRNLKQAVNQDTGKLDLRLLNDNFKKSGQSLQSYKTQLESLGRTGQEAFMHVAQAIVTADVPLRNTNKLLSNLWTSLKNTARWQLSTTMLNGFIGSIQTAYGYARDLDESLNRIQIVTKNSTEQMAAFAEQANRAAKALSTTTTEYSNAALIYYQQGLPEDQVQKRTRVTIDYANVADLSAKEASEQLTSIWNNFDDGTKSLEYYVDVMAKLGATTASSSSEISEGIQKFSAVASSVGLSYEYAASALATITAKTRESANIVGTALKTLFARIQGLSLGETLDDGTTLNKYSEALYKIGINIKDTSGNLKDMDVILDELGNRWKTLAEDEKLAVAQTVAGVRQYNQLVALMDNFDYFRENLATAYGSSGELEAQAEIYAQSWEATRDRVRAATEDIYDSLINPDFYTSVDNLLTPFLSGIATVVDSMGGMQGVLAALAALMNQVYGDNITQSLRNMATNLGFITQQEQMRAKALQEEAVQLLAQQSYFQGPFQEQSYNAKLQEAELYRDISSQMERMDSQSRALLQVDLERVKALSAQTSEFAQMAERGIGTVDEYRDRVLSGVQDMRLSLTELGQIWKNVINPSQALSNLQKGNIADIFFNINNRTINPMSTAIEYLLSELDQVAIRTARVNDLTRAYTGEITPKIIEMAQSFGLLSANANEQEIQQFFKILENGTQDSLTPMSNLVQLIRELTNTGGNAQRFASSLQQVDRASRAATESTNALNQQVNNVRTNMSTGAYVTRDWANVLVSVGSVLSGISMGINSMKSLGRVFQDEDMSAGDRMVTIFMSLSMLIPAVTTTINALTKAKAAQSAATMVFNALQGKENAMVGAGTIATLAYNIAKRKKTQLGIADTAALEAETAAQVANNAALLAGLGIFAAVVVAIAAVTGVVYAAVKAYNADADAAKEAVEQQEKLSEAYEESKAAYDSLKTSIEDYESAREGLDQLKEGTDEFKEALEKANEAALELINTNSQLAAAAYRDPETGEIKFNPGALRQYQNNKQKAMLNSQAAASFAQVEANRAQIRNDFTNLQRELVNKSGGELAGFDINNDSQFRELIEAIYKAGGIINDNTLAAFESMTPVVKDAIIDMTPDFQGFIQAAENSIQSNEFLVREGITSTLQTNSQIANLAPSFQSAITAMVQNSDTFKTVLEEEKNNNDMFSIREDFAELQGYSTTNIKTHYTNGTADYYDPETNEVVAEKISDDIAKNVVAQSKAAAASIEGELSQQYISTINKIADVNKVFQIDGLENELLGFIQKLDTSIQSANQLTLTQVNFLHDELGNVINDIGDLDWASLGYSSATNFVNTFLNALDEQWDLSTFINNYIMNLQVAAETASSALQTIGEGEFLSDEQINKLQEKFRGIFDLGDIEDLPLYSQAQLLTEALNSTFDTKAIEENLKDQTKAAKKYYEDIKEKAKETYVEVYNSASEEFEKIDKNYEKITDNWQKQGKTSKEIELDLQVGQAESKINKIEEKIKDLDNIKLDPIEIDVQMEDAWVDAALGQLGAIRAASEFVEEGFTVDAENVQQLASIMPQILEDAQVLSNGVVQLSEDVVNAYTQAAEDMKDIHGRSLEEILQQRVDNAQDEVHIIDAVNDAIQTSDGQTVAQIMQNTKLEKEDKEQAARLILKAKIEEALQRKVQDNSAAANAISNSSKVANASAGDSQVVADNWTASAKKVAENLTDAFQIAYDASQDYKKNIRPPDRQVGGSDIKVRRSTEQYEAPQVNKSAIGDFDLVEAWKNNNFNFQKTVQEAQENAGDSARFTTSDYIAKTLIKQLEDLGLGTISDTSIKTNDILNTLVEAFEGSTEEFKDSVEKASGDAISKLGKAITDLSKFRSGTNAVKDAGTDDKSSKKEKKEKEEKKPEKESFSSSLDESDLYTYWERIIKREQQRRNSNQNFDAKYFESIDPLKPVEDLQSAKWIDLANRATIKENLASTQIEKEANERIQIIAKDHLAGVLQSIKDATSGLVQDAITGTMLEIKLDDVGNIKNIDAIKKAMDKHLELLVEDYNLSVEKNEIPEEDIADKKSGIESYREKREQILAWLDEYQSALDKRDEADANILALLQERIDLLKEEWELNNTATLDQIDNLSTIEDRYKEINRQLKIQQDFLEDVSELTERAYGQDKLSGYTEKLKDLNNQVENYHKKIADERINSQADLEKVADMAQEIYEERISRQLDLINKDPDKYKSNITQVEEYQRLLKMLKDPQTILSTSNIGEIVGLDELYKAIDEPVNEAYEAYNTFMRTQWNAAPNQGLQAPLQEQKEKLEFNLQNAENNRANQLAVLDQYFEDIDNIEEDSDALKDTLREIADAELDTIVYKLDMSIQVVDMKRAVTDLSKTISESFGDAITHGIESATFDKTNVEDELSKVTLYLLQYEELINYIKDPSIYKDTEKVMEQLEDLQSKMIESSEYLLEWIESLEDMLPDAIDDAAERFSLFTNQLEHNETVLDTVKELMTLQGMTYKVAGQYSRLQNVSREKLNAQMGQAELQKRWFDNARRELMEAEKAMEGVAETDVAYDALKKNRDALLEQFNEAKEAYLSSALDAMETAKDMYMTALEKASYDFSQAVSKGQGLDLLQDKFDHYIESEEMYLDTVNELYEVNAWNLKLQTAIDEATTSSQKNKLKALQDEIDIRRKGQTLSEYDLKILKAKYDMILASNALEDAQNAKNNLRLVRDSQGNWNYQYTADDEEAGKAQEDFLEKQNEYYNIAKDQVKNVTSEILSTWQECNDKIKELYEDQTLTVDEREARIAELRAYYAEKVKILENEKQVAIYDMNQAGLESILYMAMTGEASIVDMAGNSLPVFQNFSEETMKVLDEMSKNGTQTISDFTKCIVELLTNAGVDSSTILSGITLDANGNIIGLSESLTKTLESMGIDTQAILRGEAVDLAKIFQKQIYEKNYGITKNMATDIVNKLGELANGGSTEVEGLSDNVQSFIDDMVAGSMDATGVWNNDFAETLDDMTEKATDFDSTLDDYLNNMSQNWTDYQGTISEVADNTGTDMTTLKDRVDEARDATDLCRVAGEECADSLWDNLSKIQDTTQAYLELAEAVMKVVEAMKEQSNNIYEDVRDYKGTTSFDKDVDYSAVVASYLGSGGQIGDEIYQELTKQRDAKINEYLIPNKLSFPTYGKQRYGNEFDEWLSETISNPHNAAYQEWYLPTSSIYEGNKLSELIERLTGLTANVKSYDKSVDYSALVASYLGAGGQIGDEIYEELTRQRDAKIDRYLIPNKMNFLTYGESLYGDKFDKWISEIIGDHESDAYQDWYLPSSGIYGEGTNGANTKLKELIKKLTGLTTSFDTGGYTGDFQNQKLAFLHEKELILNREDTQNILSAVSAVRSLASTDIFSHIAKILDGNVQAGLELMSSKLLMNSTTSQPEQLEQNVHIEAVFPNVVHSSEIQDAFASLVNDAAQWIHRKKE